MESEVDDFKAECEKGNEDKATCDSYNEWLAWKDAHESALEKISAKQSNIRFKRQAEQEPGDIESEVDDFKAECEKGNEDKATCDSYNEWLAWKDAHESALEKISAKQTNIRLKRQAEQEDEMQEFDNESNLELSEFKKACEEGTEDKDTCDSFYNVMKKKEEKKNIFRRKRNAEAVIETGKDKENYESNLEISEFKKACEEGTEDKDTCDSFYNLMKKKEEKKNIFRRKRNAEAVIETGKDKENYESNLEISEFKKACEEGTEDKDTCDSFYNLMKKKEEKKNIFRRKRNAEAVIETGKDKENYESNLEISEFKKACEEGTEDKDTCDSFYNLMKKKEEKKNIFRRKRNAEAVIETGKDKENYESNLEISEFKKACEEGTEDKDTCDSFYNLMKEKDEQNNIFRRKRNAEALIETGKDKENYESNLEISEFKKACEEGTEDKDTCDSFYNLMKEKEEQKNIFRRKRNAEALIETGKDKENYESNLEILEFKKACEEGTEDKDTCDSFYNLMKEKEDENVFPRGRRDTKGTYEVANVNEKDLNDQNPGDMHPNIEEDEKSRISKLTKDCEDGKEDQDTCDSYFKWMEWKKNHDAFLKRNNENESGDHLNNRVGKAAEKKKQTSDGHKKEEENGDSERSEEDESKLRKLDAKIRADFEQDDVYSTKIAKGRTFQGPSSAERSSTLRKNSGEFKRRSSHSLDGFETELDQANARIKDADKAISENNEPVVRPRMVGERDMQVPKLHHRHAISKRQRRTVAEVLYKLLAQKNAAHKRISPGRK
ncbi:myb-like protein X [Rhopilema esculentum]|uniref:myb-like protein X n=1 Tax=Rhopilema esculentum TaxID=499914 RepID=UPI0031E290A2|eukprot:gene13673-4576_t